MKKNIITIIVIILILAAMAAAIWLADKLFYARDGETVVSQETYSADRITSVTVSVDVGYVELVERTDSDVFSVSTVGVDEGFYTVSTEGGVLSVTSEELRWYDRELYKTADSYGITIGVPASFDGDVSIVTTAGAVTATAITVKELNVSVEVGDITMSSVSAPVLDVYTEVGNVKIEKAAADTVTVGTDVGNVSFTEAETSSASVCITTDVGDIALSLAGARADYAISAHSDSGNCNVKEGGDGIYIELSTDVGNINVRFGK